MRPQRDVLTTRRCGQQHSPARVALKICSLPGAVAAQGSRSRAWCAAGRRIAAEARRRLQFPVPHVQCSRPTRDIRSPARLHTDRCSKLPSDSLSPHLGNMFCEPPPTMSTPGFEPGLSRPQRDVLTTRRCGQQCSLACVALQVCSLLGAVAAQDSRSQAWRAAGRRSTAEARGRLQHLVPHAQRSRSTLDIRTPARLHTDTRSKLPSHDP